MIDIYAIDEDTENLGYNAATVKFIIDAKEFIGLNEIDENNKINCLQLQSAIQKLKDHEYELDEWLTPLEFLKQLEEAPKIFESIEQSPQVIVSENSEEIEELSEEDFIETE